MPEIVIPDLSHSLCLEQFRKTLCDVVGLDQIANLVDTYILKVGHGLQGIHRSQTRYELEAKAIKNLHLFCKLVHEIIAFKEVFVYNRMEIMISG